MGHCCWVLEKLSGFTLVIVCHIIWSLWKRHGKKQNSSGMFSSVGRAMCLGRHHTQQKIIIPRSTKWLNRKSKRGSFQTVCEYISNSSLRCSIWWITRRWNRTNFQFGIELQKADITKNRRVVLYQCHPGRFTSAAVFVITLLCLTFYSYLSFQSTRQTFLNKWKTKMNLQKKTSWNLSGTDAANF